ncbi:MAG TPA: ThiF family adenylyltransferase [Candidatus Acidoferrales bacterium]|nr:ThiF family adenylyltransferase [Candidatus Acidoferrales bacterium]
MDSENYERYSRQILFAGIGEQGQQKLLESSAVVVGCGALGTAAAGSLARAGVGRIRIIDRDFVEWSNLQRQSLFEESDARQSLPKAVAAERKLRAMNSGVTVEGVVADLEPAEARELLSGFSVMVDGTDNFETRFLMNDFAVAAGMPWIYGAVVAGHGVTMAIQPGRTACLACLMESGPGGGLEETCETVGVLNSAAMLIGALEATAALRLLVSGEAEAGGRLISADVWSGRFQSLAVQRDAACRACVRRDLRYLEGKGHPHVTLCGRDSVQIHQRERRLDLAALSRRLERTAGDVRGNDFLVRFRVAAYELIVFADGRAIVKGTTDAAVARSLYARYIGA